MNDRKSTSKAPRESGSDADDEYTTTRPAPEAFDDHRQYLRAMIKYLKATKPQFSYRYFSRIAGFRSPNFLQLVADGKRNLSTPSIAKFAKGLGLDEQERESFETLVLLGQATSDVDRNRYYLRLQRNKKSESTGRIEEAQYRVYSQPYAIAIREMLLLPDFREDPAWIGKRLSPSVTPGKVKQALELLQEVGLVVRDENGRLRSSNTKLSTGPKVRSLAIRNFHRGMMAAAADTLDTVAQNRRDITSLTLALSPSQYDMVRSKVEQFRRELLDLIDDDRAKKGAEDDSDVFHLGFQLFPVTRRSKT